MRTTVLEIDENSIDANNIELAAEFINKGKLVAFPTETVYGLGADAFNPNAVARIFEAKNRPFFDPLIVHISELSQVDRVCTGVIGLSRKLMEEFWPGPLTLVLPKADAVPGIVTAGLPTVAIRMPAHPIALRLIEEADTPIAAPSANLFGFLSPTTAEHVRKQLDGKVDMILDGGKCPVGVESTILDLTGQEPIVLRPGGLAIEDIEKAIGKVRIAVHTPERPQSPGQLPRHYSPRTPMIILEVNNVRVPSGKKVGLLAFKRSGNVLPYDVVEVLSPNGDLREAAANLFSCLHRLDRAGLDIIYAEPVPETGLGLAIMNRLRKAAGQNHHGISEVR